MSVRTALQLNAVVGLASTLAASATLSLVLTQPQAIASAVAQHDGGAVLMAMATQVFGWLHALLRFV
jgi:hypothetical protein